MRREGKKRGAKDTGQAHSPESASPLTPHPSPGCELCSQDGGALLHRDPELRIVLVDDADYPGFCRVIWNAHVKETTDLPPDARARLMHAVFATEAAVRSVCAPLKVNLASLGNVVPHLHWHVIPRHADDAHFPQPVWGTRQRAAASLRAVDRARLCAALAAALALP